MSLFYYLPGLKTVSLHDVSAAGLDHAREVGAPSYAEMSPGPDGGAGVVFRFDDGGCGDVEKLCWTRNGKTAWVGFTPANRPGPERLARRKTIAGREVELADGNRWPVPVARRIDGEPGLPRRLEYDGEAWRPGAVLPLYASLFDEAARIFDSLINADAEDDAPLTLSDECDLAARALQINYRVGPAEISALGLFDTRTHADVLLAMVDWPTVLAFKKKVDSGEVSLPAGGED